MSLIHVGMALLVVISWGLAFAFIRLGLEYWSPLFFAHVRFLLTAFPLVFFIKRPSVPWKITIAFGLLQYAGLYGFLFVAISEGMPAGLASLIVQLQVFLTILLAIFLFRERLHFAQFASILIAFSGLIYAAFHVGQGMTLIGFILVLLGALCWAGGNTLFRWVKREEILRMVVWSSLFAPLPLLALSFWFEGPHQIMLDIQATGIVVLLVAAALAYVSTVAAFALWGHLLSIYPASIVSPFALLIPVFGFGSVHFFFDEPLENWKLVTGFLILVALAINTFSGRFKPKAG